jgi:hypothetical protein
MRSNSNDVVVGDAMDCGSGGGGLVQLRLDRCGGGGIGAAAELGGGGGVDLAQGRSADAGEAS